MPEAQTALQIAQLVSIVLAAIGTPGITYKVIMKLHESQMKAFQTQCSSCKAGLKHELESLGSEVDTLQGRQKTLREETIPSMPDRFITRREHEACRAEHEACRTDRKSHENELFNRVGSLERQGKREA